MKPAFNTGEAMRRASEACSFVVVACSCLALLSWAAGRWRLVAFGPDYVPMAPSTALTMLLLNVAVPLRSRFPGRPAAMRFALCAAAAVAAVGLSVLLQWRFGFELPFEEWLAPAAESVRQIPVGRMSPLTAASILLAAGALTLLSLPLRRRPLFDRCGGVLAHLTTLTGLYVLLGYFSGTPFLYGGRTIPMALWTALTLLLTGLALPAAGEKGWEEFLHSCGWMCASAAPGRLDRRLPAAFLVLTVAIGTAGLFYLRQQQAAARRAMRDELAAIAQLKTDQIVNWRTERLGDANLIKDTPFPAEAVERFLNDSSDQDVRGALLRWMTSLRDQNGYSRILLLDRDVRPRLTTREGEAAGSALDPSVARLAAEALRTNRIVISDLHRSQTLQGIRMEWLVPVRVPAVSPDSAAPIALILLEIDPHRFLYPLVQSWPLPSRTGETVLIRREGDQALFMNELRHRAGTALSLSVPLSERDSPAAVAVRGRWRVAEGVDYRGERVLGAFRPVPDSPWFLEAKVDQDEVYASLFSRALAVGGIVALMLVTMALGVSLVWRQRDAAFLGRELAHERERKALAERFAHLMKNANDIILLADGESRILEANDRALESYGYSQEELLGMSLRELRAPETAGDFSQQADELDAVDHLLFETLHRRRDGSVFPVEVSARIVEIGGSRYKMGLVRDITERREHEREIERLNRLYATLSHVNQSLVQAGSREELFNEICRIAVRFGGFKLAWIGRRNPKSGEIEPVACAGEPMALVGKIRHGTEDCPQQGCVCGAAVHDERLCVADDLRLAPRMQPWLNEFEEAGIRSAAAFPIRLNGRVHGVLTLYAAEAGVFMEKEVQLLEEVALDISFGLDRMESAAQLQVTLGRLATLVRTSPLPIILTDPEGAVTLWNPAAERVFGWTEAEVLGREDPSFPSEEADEASRLRERILGGETLEHREMARRRKDGERIHVSFSAAALQDTQKDPVGVMAIMEDITELKRVQDRILTLNEELEERVRERTVRLEEVNKELEAFSYSVSHDLRAPLRHVGGYVDLLVRRCGNELSEKGRHYLDNIAGSAQEMGRLIDDLLQFSRTGRMEMRQSRMGMNQALQEVLGPLRKERHGRNIEWVVATLPDVYGDYAMLRLVWANLLDNAVKYTRGTDPVRIEAGWREEDDEIVFYVRDNGVGFDMQYAGKLFGVFQRLHSAEEFEGTGIGLANVRRIIARHGGRTWAEGEPGRGAAFYFSVPKR